jgi:hypothetical protein
LYRAESAFQVDGIGWAAQAPAGIQVRRCVIVTVRATIELSQEEMGLRAAGSGLEVANQRSASGVVIAALECGAGSLQIPLRPIVDADCH